MSGLVNWPAMITMEHNRNVVLIYILFVIDLLDSLAVVLSNPNRLKTAFNSTEW